MPTSGGGGHGGFGGGGSFHSGGGSRGGSSFHLNTFWFFAPHYYYRRGIGVFFAPIASLIVIFALICVSLGGAVNLARNKQVAYSESTAEEYALTEYDIAFGREKAYEDKVLLVFFAYENCVDYDFIAMIGDDLTNSVYNSLRGSRSELERAMDRYISTVDYETTLGRNLSSVVDELAGEISSFGDPFRAGCKDSVHVEGNSYLRNESQLQIDAEMVDQSLTAFTGATGIEMVIVVADAADVFGYETPTVLLFFCLFLVILAGAIIYAIVSGVKARREHQNGNSSGSNGGYTTGAQMDGTQKNNDFPSGDNW